MKNPRKIWLTPALCKKAQLLPSIAIRPGGREVMADVFRVRTPFNDVPYLLSVAAGLQLMHGPLIRSKTDGQLPMVCYIFRLFYSTIQMLMIILYSC